MPRLIKKALTLPRERSKNKPASRPSLNALRAFEATARLRSFTAAAEELSVTHGAISRQVRSLEEAVGVQLLRRNAHGTEATAQGSRLAEGLSSAFNLIRSSLDQIKPGPLTLSCSESIMMYWLLPRISRFQLAHPEIDLRFNMSHGPVDFARDNIGIAIRLSSIEAPKDALVTDVVDEWVGPVCSATYLQSHRLQSVADLPGSRLLTSKTRPSSWTEWLKASGQSAASLHVADAFEHFYLLIQAAKCSLGIANVPWLLVQDDLRAGTLVAPFGFVRGPNRLVLWLDPHVGSSPEVDALEQWLIGELRDASDMQ